MIKTYAQTAKFTNKEDWAKFETKVKQLGIDALSQNCMLQAHELLKQDKKNAAAALNALTSDPLNVAKVYQAVKTHKRLTKADAQIAAKYFSAA